MLLISRSKEGSMCEERSNEEDSNAGASQGSECPLCSEHDTCSTMVWHPERRENHHKYITALIILASSCFLSTQSMAINMVDICYINRSCSNMLGDGVQQVGLGQRGPLRSQIHKDTFLLSI